MAREQAGTLRAVDEALAALNNLAKKTLAAVEARKKLIDAITLDEAAGSLQPLAIESPKNGVIRTLSAEIGEIVATGAPLFEVMQMDPIWIKASIYAGDIEAFDRDEPALVGDLAERDPSKTRAARPIPAPPTATPLAATVDLYFELSNDDGRSTPVNGCQSGSPRDSAASHAPFRGRPWYMTSTVANGSTSKPRLRSLFAVACRSNTYPRAAPYCAMDRQRGP